MAKKIPVKDALAEIVRDNLFVQVANTDQWVRISPVNASHLIRIVKGAQTITHENGFVYLTF